MEPFKISDYEELRRFWASSGLERSLGDDRVGLLRKLRRDPELFIVAKQEGKIVGSAIGAWDGRRGWIYHLAVSEASRRKGIGSQLLARIEHDMRQKGVLKVNAVVFDDNFPSLELFRRRGFKVQRGQVIVGKRLTQRAKI